MSLARPFAFGSGRMWSLLRAGCFLSSVFACRTHAPAEVPEQETDAPAEHPDVASRPDSSAREVHATDSGLPAIAPDVRLERTTREHAADRMCCDDRRLVRWTVGSFAVPSFELVPNAREPVVQVRMDDAEIPRDLYVALQRGNVDLPPGRVSASVVSSGILVGIDSGEYGGELLHVDFQGGVRKVSSG